MPLVYAIWHGSRGDWHDLALRKICISRLSKLFNNASGRTPLAAQLKASAFPFSATSAVANLEIAVLADFYFRPWEERVNGLSEESRRFVDNRIE
ncbi:MAG: hypothetical protein H7A47_17500 [Verrucomicrobiales bacterium]|nr:hypothetical protein [Verrucomicrobiales bacterium]